MKKYSGCIIEESLTNKDVLKEFIITRTNVEKVTEESNTPDLDVWTMHIVEITEDKIESIVPLLSKSIDGSRKNGGWYTDLKSDDWHYIIFSGKVFKVDRSSGEQYEQAKEYGMSIGIPEYQLPNKSWAKNN